MNSNSPAPTGPRSPEMARRLRARERRTKVIRRRVIATSLILLASMWGTVFALGSLGKTATHTATTAVVADVRTTATPTTATNARKTTTSTPAVTIDAASVTKAAGTRTT